MATQAPDPANILYLDQITLQGVPNSKYELELFVGNQEIEVQQEGNQIWTPARRLGVSSTSVIRVEIQRTTGKLFWAKSRQADGAIDLQALFDEYWSSNKHEFTVPKVIVFGKRHGSLELRFSANATVELLRSSLVELEGLIKEYTPLMNRSLERALGTGVKFGTALSELNPIAKAAFGVAKVTFELLKEQNKYDQMPSALLDRLQRILPLADKVADEIVGEETDILDKIIPRMFEVMHKTAKFSCNYVKRGRFKQAGDAFIYSMEKEMIEELDGKLAEVIEDFMRAVDVEALRLAKRNELVEQELLLKRLDPIKAGYHQDLRCMEGTRKSLLKEIVDWVANKSEENNLLQSNTYWIYGLPGIGKTSLAHSICASLHDQGRLAGAFFCRRDDPNLSELRNILPTLICRLAGVFPSFRSVVANCLRNDSNLTAESMKDSLFLELIHNLPHGPDQSLVIVIDAFDECGNYRNRPALLKLLINATARASWLKMIITSRPEADIQISFDALTPSSYLRYDLAADQEANGDLRTFAQSEFDPVARKWHLPASWPEESLLNKVISRANGLFIFIKTLVLALEHCEDPTEFLEATAEDSAGTGLKPLYTLYSSILKSRIVQSKAEFQRVIGVLLTTAPYRALREETIAELAGVKLNLVQKWVDDLSSLLYRDEGANGAVRVRHLSISDFFISDDCPCGHQISTRDASMQLGIACLETMVRQLRFNICGLKDSRLANADIEDLPSRIIKNISDSLQYSSLYWSNHLCSTPDTNDRRVWESLEEFFGGPCPLFWIEVLSIMGMVPIGAPSVRRVLSWTKNVDLILLERIRDVSRFIIAFHTPILTSAPHTYLSTQPFLPSESPLSHTFSTRFTKGIKMLRGKLSSWPAPPLNWSGHHNMITCVSYSPDGRHVLSGSWDKNIRIWDAETGAVIGEPLQGHTKGLLSIAYSPDGRHIISGSADNTIRIWDAEIGAAVGNPLEGHTSGVSSVAYSPDGRHIISGSHDTTIRIWDADTGVAVGSPLEGHTDGVSSVAYSPDGRHIISGSDDTTIRIWDADTGTAVGHPLVGHTARVSSVAYSPDGRHITSGSSDETIQIWDAETGAAVGNPLKGNTEGVCSVAYSPDGRHVISGSCDKIIRIWDVETGAVVGKPLEGHTDIVFSVAYSPDGRHIVSGDADCMIRIWNANTGTAVGKPLEGHTSAVSSFAYSPDGRHIASGSFDETIRIWDAETGAAVGNPIQGHTDRVTSIAYSPDGRLIISGSDDHTIRIWDAESGTAVGDPLEGHIESVSSVAYSPDGRHIVSGDTDCTIRIWDAETGAAVGDPLEEHTGGVSSVAYSPNGRHIISGSDDQIIIIWDAETGAVVGKLLEGHNEGVSCIAYSPDGQYIVSGSKDSTIRIWDADTCDAVGKPLKGHDRGVCSVACSPDGRYIISGSDDNTIRIWDTDNGASVGNPLLKHFSVVSSVAYSPDGRHIASGSFDSMIRIWDTETSVVDTVGMSSVAYSPDGRHITSGSYDNTIRIWDAKTGAAVGHPLEGHTEDISFVAYSPDGRHIISGSDDTTIRIWDAGTGVAVGNPLEGHLAGVLSVAYSPDGRHVISGSYDATIRIWDAHTCAAVGNPLQGHSEAVSSVAYSPDGRHITSGSFDETIQVWDAGTGAAVGSPLEGHTEGVLSVAYSPDGRHIISGSGDNMVRIWDAQIGAAVGKPLEGHTSSVWSVAYSPDGQYIVSGSDDATIRIWDAKTGDAVGKPLEGHITGVVSVAYSPNGRHILSGAYQYRIRIWDAETGAPVGQPLEGHTDSVICPIDGQYIISRSGDLTARVWEPFQHEPNSLCNPSHPYLFAPPDSEGWVKDADGGLLYWVPTDCRAGLHSIALITFPPTSSGRAVCLDFKDFAFGTSWTQILDSVQH